MKNPKLVVSLDGRGLTTEAGAPFFYLADTAWELVHRLDARMARHYLRDRAAKGFTVIQTSVLAPLRGLVRPNALGQLPFQNKDPLQPNESYFSHLDTILDLAEEMGLHVALNPAWGSYVSDPEWESDLIFTEGSARAFGAFLGRRYRARNLIWMLGGGRSALGVESVWAAMAKGLRAGGGGDQLMTLMPREYMSSSRRWHQVEWLDFNCIFSGDKRRFNNNYDLVEHDWANEPAKPTLDAALCADGAYVAGNPQNGRFDAYDVRIAAYRSVLAGGCGVGYRCGAVWQMWSPESEFDAPIGAPAEPWHEQLNRPAVHQLRYLKNLILSRSAHHRFRDDSLLVYNGNPWEQRYAARHASSLPIASRDGTEGRPDASFVMVYFPSTPSDIEIRVSDIDDPHLHVYWFDPRSGVAYEEPPAKNTGVYRPEWGDRFWSAADTNGPDWLLIIESAGIAYERPQG